jgi:hypothetical protein
MVLMAKDARIAHFFSESRKPRVHNLLVQCPFNFYAVPTTCFTYGYPLLMTKQTFQRDQPVINPRFRDTRHSYLGLQAISSMDTAEFEPSKLGTKAQYVR